MWLLPFPSPVGMIVHFYRDSDTLESYRASKSSLAGDVMYETQALITEERSSGHQTETRKNLK